ncbi:hypothetical protein ES703_95702 [subsurface metagenome]
MEGQTKMKMPRESIDGLLNSVQVDLDSVQKTILEIKRTLLGLEVPTPVAEAEKKAKIPSGWFNRIIERLNDFGRQLRRIHQLQSEVLNAITGNPELKEMGE